MELSVRVVAACRPCPNGGKADALGEETSRRTRVTDGEGSKPPAPVSGHFSCGNGLTIRPGGWLGRMANPFYKKRANHPCPGAGASAEITAGRSRPQQGLTATCKAPPTEANEAMGGGSTGA